MWNMHLWYCKASGSYWQVLRRYGTRYGKECMGDYFQEGLRQDHDNDDGNSNIADEAEDHVNMLEVELPHKWLCMNDGRCYMTKWNISTYNKQSYYIWYRGFYTDYIGCSDKVAQAVVQHTNMMVMEIIKMVMEMMKMHICCAISYIREIIYLIHNILLSDIYHILYFIALSQITQQLPYTTIYELMQQSSGVGAICIYLPHHHSPLLCVSHSHYQVLGERGQLGFQHWWTCRKYHLLEEYWMMMTAILFQ